MSATEGFDFVAPQFVEPLGDGDLDDGADSFFDAQENGASSSSTPVIKEDDNSKAKEDVGEKCTTEDIVAEPTKTCLGDMEPGNCPDENMQPPSIKNIKPARETRLYRMSMQKVSSPSRRSSRFISQAEQILKFHHSTPPRFKRKSGVLKSRMSKMMPTIAQSPMLQTKARARQSTMPTSTTIPDRPVLRPLRRMEARPPPKPAPKPATVPQPFNLTDVNKFKKSTKTAGAELAESIAKAKSTITGRTTAKGKTNKLEIGEAEKRLKSPPGGAPAPKTPSKPVNVKKKTLEVRGDKVVVTENWAITGLKISNKANTSTKPVPFSFESRNQERLKAKQMKLEQAKEGKNDTFKVPNKVRPSTAVGLSKPELKKNIPRASLNRT